MATSRRRTPASSVKSKSGFSTPKSGTGGSKPLLNENSTNSVPSFDNEGEETSNVNNAPGSKGQVNPVYPYVLLCLVAVCALLTPLVIIYESLPHAGEFHKHQAPQYPTRAVVEHPQEGVHFRRGELHPEGRALGPQESQRWVLEFTDFFCEHCQEAHRKIIEPLLRDYVPQGLLRVESHPVAFLDNDSLRAAHAALCAQEQHKYWEVRDLLFKVNVSSKASSASGTAFSGTVLKQISAKAKLDHMSFVECFKSGRHSEEIKMITELASVLGVRETPTIFASGQKLIGSHITLDEVKIKLGLPV